MAFMDQLKNVLNNRIAYTENGARAYATTGKSLVDLNFAAASLRSMGEEEIVNRFIRAFYEDRMLALKWLFFLRDIRGGLGERRSFRMILRHLAETDKVLAGKLVEIVAEYGRYDDLLCLFDTAVEEQVLAYIAHQLNMDMEVMKMKQPVSLCAKWMPGNNTSSVASRENALKIQNYMGLTAKEYRSMLAELRAYLKVVEVQMSANNWDAINYEAVPSGANLLYRKAFYRHDEERRKAFLEAVAKNEKKIHAGVLMPHDIVAKYAARKGWYLTIGEEDASLEALWNHLSDTVNGAENVLCVVDGSGSMLCPVGDGNVTALHVSNALGIYFAEWMQGAYKNQFITFSSQPQYVDISKCRSLREKLELAFSHTDCSNTNIQATFELILQTAVKNQLAQEELPATVLVISDMEFDSATYGQNTETLFETIRKRFASFGYQMPKLVFWNVNSRTNTIPVRENQLGVGLVSGFSVNVCNMVLSNELDPYECLKKTLEGERYRRVEECVA